MTERNTGENFKGYVEQDFSRLNGKNARPSRIYVTNAQEAAKREKMKKRIEAEEGFDMNAIIVLNALREMQNVGTIIEPQIQSNRVIEEEQSNPK